MIIVNELPDDSVDHTLDILHKLGRENLLQLTRMIVNWSLDLQVWSQAPCGSLGAPSMSAVGKAREKERLRREKEEEEAQQAGSLFFKDPPKSR